MGLVIVPRLPAKQRLRVLDALQLANAELDEALPLAALAQAAGHGVQHRLAHPLHLLSDLEGVSVVRTLS